MKPHFLIIAVVAVGCSDTAAPPTASPQPSVPSHVTSNDTPATASPQPKQTPFDIVQSCVLRDGPNETSERKVNEKATRMLGETHYQQVDSSVTVEVLQRKNGWAEVRVLQPIHLRDTHRGWIPENALYGGPATAKRDGWIRKRCNVYDDADPSAAIVGHLTPPSSVGVADDGSGWLRLIHGPIRGNSPSGFVESPNFDDGLYIESKAFTTTLPANW